MTGSAAWRVRNALELVAAPQSLAELLGASPASMAAFVGEPDMPCQAGSLLLTNRGPPRDTLSAIGARLSVQAKPLGGAAANEDNRRQSSVGLVAGRARLGCAYSLSATCRLLRAKRTCCDEPRNVAYCPTPT